MEFAGVRDGAVRRHCPESSGGATVLMQCLPAVSTWAGRVEQQCGADARRCDGPGT